jgi:soluble lytic murein transglycosylase-like protein
MLFILISIGFIVAALLEIKPTPALNSSAAANQNEQQALAAGAAAEAETTTGDVAQTQAQPVASGAISPVFAAPVQYWAPQIEAWSAVHGIDPNLAATIMQVESCGDPNAVSSAGAQGLFQVMPFHFTAGENMQDPDTNASRGLAYFVERLQQTGGDIGRAFAGYNGGHRAAATTWDNWPNETQRYYTWTTGIYNEIQQGLNPSPTLQQWLQAGGASLCNQAATRLGLSQ